MVFASLEMTQGCPVSFLVLLVTLVVSVLLVLPLWFLLVRQAETVAVLEE